MTSVFDVSKRLPCGVTSPDVMDPIVNPLWNWRRNSSKFEDIIGSSIMTIRLVLTRISLKAALCLEKKIKLNIIRFQ